LALFALAGGKRGWMSKEGEQHLSKNKKNKSGSVWRKKQKNFSLDFRAFSRLLPPPPLEPKKNDNKFRCNSLCELHTPTNDTALFLSLSFVTRAGASSSLSDLHLIFSFHPFRLERLKGGGAAPAGTTGGSSLFDPTAGGGDGGGGSGGTGT
jgi:hypothetical protein